MKRHKRSFTIIALAVCITMLGSVGAAAGAGTDDAAGAAFAIDAAAVANRFDNSLQEYSFDLDVFPPYDYALNHPMPTIKPPAGAAATEAAPSATQSAPAAQTAPQQPASQPSAPQPAAKQPEATTQSTDKPAAAGFSDAQINKRLIALIEGKTGVEMAAETTEEDENTGITEPAPADSSVSDAIATDVVMTYPAIDAAAGGGDGADEAVAPGYISITNPKNIETGDNSSIADTVYKSTYSICGVLDEDIEAGESIILYVTKYDGASEKYVEYADVDGEARWTVGANGVFTRSVLLEEGENNIAIAACKSSSIDAAKSEGRQIADSEIQIIKFKILYREKTVAEMISEVLKELTIANIIKEMEIENS